MGLSVVLATHNESANLAKCLASVKGLADEIIIVDGDSTDDTTQIAKQFSAKIISTTNKANFHINKQMGLQAAKGPWILQLDADEEVSPGLAADIKKVISALKPPTDLITDSKQRQLFARHQKLIEMRDGQFFQSGQPVVGYFLPRQNQFLGRGMRYAGMYPDGVIRLVKKDRAFFPCKSVHEQINLEGSVAWLPHDLIHYDSPTFAKYLERANRYTTFTADQMAKAKLPLKFTNHLKYLILKPIGTFLSLYFRHKGLLDGFPGFVFALFSGLHWSLAYMKYYGSRQ